jgi:hypothetical protein
MDSTCAVMGSRTNLLQGPPAAGARKRLFEDPPDVPPRKRRRTGERDPNTADDTAGEPPLRTARPPADPIEFWATEGTWPPSFRQEDTMERVLARKRSSSNLGRKRSNSATSTTPSDPKPREEQSAPYRDPRYETLLATKGSFMVKSSQDITDASKTICRTLLEKKQTVPADSLFRDDIFESTCQKIQSKNEARVIQDISRLIVPSAETLATCGARDLDILTESVNEGWNNAILLAGSRPQPDYSVGFKREAFTDDQLRRLSPFFGDWLAGDLSYFMATYYMHFPFLTCEVKCGAAALDVADRQNAHSMTIAVRAVLELFRLVGRESELHREILGFSVSHDHCSVRIYGHYPIVGENDTKYYRHPIRKFDITELDGREKWTAHKFTKNVYTWWMPKHFERLCSAIDQLPFVPPSEKSGLSQELESCRIPELEVDLESSKAEPQPATPDASLEQGATKRRRRQKSARVP